METTHLDEMSCSSNSCMFELFIVGELLPDQALTQLPALPLFPLTDRPWMDLIQRNNAALLQIAPVVIYRTG